MDTRNKEQWLTETLGSIDHINRAEANLYLYSKIKDRLGRVPTKSIQLQPQLAWSVAACMAVLLGLNIISWVHFGKTSTSLQKNDESAFVQEYFPNITNNDQF